MYLFNAFVVIPELCNNAVNAIAKFGELSVKSSTFSKDIRNYTDKVAFPGVELVSFTLQDNNSQPVNTAPLDLTGTALQISTFLYTQYSKNAIPLPTSKATLVAGMTKEFTKVRNIYINAIVDADVTGKRLIDYISYEHVVEGVEYKVTLWFSDQKFRVQYPLYEIEIVPPIGDVSRLNDVPANVIEAIDAVEVDFAINRIDGITKQHPQTALQTIQLTWHDPNGSKTTKLTRWTAVIWGQAGNDQDLVKDAIRSYLEKADANINWTKIFPDLYSENEFLLMPTWAYISTPTEGYDDGLYSSMMTYRDLSTESLRIIPRGYVTGSSSLAHRDENLIVMGTQYRGINIMSIGNPNNKGGLFNLRKMFPDYMSVASDKSDFARMSSRTQDFILLLMDVLEQARAWTPNGEMGTNVYKQVKANREYLAFDFDGFKYMVLTRYGYLKDM